MTHLHTAAATPAQRSTFSLNGKTAVWLGLLALAALLAWRWRHGPIAQAQDFHAFADHATWLGIPSAANVLSNWPFVVFGVWGLWLLRTAAVSNTSRVAAAVFFMGLALTGIGSSLYHWAPNDAGLALDRLCMTVAFAGVLGWASAEQINSKTGHVVLQAAAVAAPASVLLWALTGDLTAYVLVQFGGMLALLGLAFCKPSAPQRPGAGMRKALLSVLAWYMAAKAFEAADHAVFDGTQHLMSGHTLKHPCAACAAWPLLKWLNQRRA